MKKTWLVKLQQQFPHLNFQEDFLLSNYSYFQIGGPAEVFVKVEFVPDIQELVEFCQLQNVKLTILGAGSNVIVADEGINGLVISVVNKEIEQLAIQDGLLHFRAGAGIKTTQLARKISLAGGMGLEPFVGVPGTLGGAVYNNAHFQQTLIGDYISQVQVIDETGNLNWVDVNDCEFAYEQSRFQTTNEIIVRVDFVLVKGDPAQARGKMKQATQYRAQTQPTQPSCGCVFQNVKNNDSLKKLFPQFAERDYVPAGFLIEQAGLKGLRVGDIEVSAKHAAFLINKGQGTAADVKTIIKKIKAKVEARFKVRLAEEVFYLE